MSDFSQLCRYRRGYERTSAHNRAEAQAAQALKALNAVLVDDQDHVDEADFDAFAEAVGAIFRSLGPDDEYALVDQINRTLRAFQHAAGDFSVTDTETWDALARMELARLEVEVFTAIARDAGLAIARD